MAAMTTEQLLHELRDECDRSTLVEKIEERVVDQDVLDARVHLTKVKTFISVFYNLDTDKTSFALISNESRIYGVDNAKRGWHRHPFENPEKHEACDPVSFAQFLSEVEAHYRHE